MKIGGLVMMSRILIIILTLFAITCIIIDHIITRKEHDELEYRVLKLEERIEKCRLEMYGRINAIKMGIPDIMNIERKVKK